MVILPRLIYRCNEIPTKIPIKHLVDTGKLFLKFIWEGTSPVAAAAKSLHSGPTLCNLIDGSPPGSRIPGILQARTLEWVAISFSNAWKWKGKVKLLSRVWLLVTLWTAAYQTPPSVGFSRQEDWSGLPLPSPGTSTKNMLKKLNLWWSKTQGEYVYKRGTQGSLLVMELFFILIMMEPQIYICDNIVWNYTHKGFSGGSVAKNPPANAEDAGSIPGLGRLRKWQSTTVFLPEKFHRQRTWWAIVHGVTKDSDMT